MKITLLGTGTSQGIPIIGCNCKTCKSNNPKDKRLRTSAYIEVNNLKILIDTSIDFRQQMLTNNITDLNAILFTHHHVDHIFGLDDLRQINQRYNKFIDIYGNETTLNEIKITFRYILDEELIKYRAVPLVNFNYIDNNEFFIGDQKIIPIEVFHGRLKIFGYRINDFAYITDCSNIPDIEMKKLYGLKILVLNALRRAPHPTHFNLSQAIDIAQSVRPELTYFTHITHDLNYEEISRILPDNIFLGYDGLTLTI
jgi:phosphoribosyl 1,2-cyclic phosphate phosphodiesterase